MFAWHSIDFHYFLLLGLIAVVALDLSLRWSAFRRIESVALDISIFTSLYCLAEWVWHNDLKSEWGPKTFGCVFAVIVLTAVHSLAYQTWLRHELLRDLTDDITDAVEGVESREVLRKLGRLLERSIPLTIEFSEVSVRGGKLKIREEAAGLVNGLLPLLGAKPETVAALAISEKSFLLERRTRILLNLFFFVVGSASLLTPAVSW